MSERHWSVWQIPPASTDALRCHVGNYPSHLTALDIMARALTSQSISTPGAYLVARAGITANTRIPFIDSINVYTLNSDMTVETGLPAPPLNLTTWPPKP